MFDKWRPFTTQKPKLDPYANRKTVAQWLAELSTTDIDATYEHILLALQALRQRNGEMAESDRLDVAMAIDDYAQSFIHTLSTQYLRNSRLPSSVGTKLWRNIYSYYNVLSHLYYEAILSPSRHPVGLLPEINLRALHNLGNLFKWRFFHYDLPDENLWLMLNNAYRNAEDSGFATRLIPLVGTTEARCSNQYMRALLLSQVHASSLLVKQIEMADLWLLKWVHLIEIEKNPTAERHHFCVDLTKATGAEPISSQAYSDSYRAWNASALLGQLRRTREEITTSKPNSPTESDARSPEYLKMLAYAELQWTPGNLGKLRRNPRMDTHRILTVIHGFYLLCTALKVGDTPGDDVSGYDANLRYDEMIDIQLYGFVTDTTRNRQRQSATTSKKIALPVENWATENISQKGYLACSPASNNNWLRLGCLTGVREDQQQWKIAVVRRLFRDQENNTHAGLEILAQAPMLLTLLPVAGPSTATRMPAADDGSLMALMISTPRNGHFSLIIDSVQYARERQFRTILEQKNLLISLDRVLEKGDTWTLVGASVLG